jgi:5'-nucleotidase / UDP-sugar diphosphatase
MTSGKLYRHRIAALLLCLFLIGLTSFGQENSNCIVRVTLLQLNDVYQFAPVDQGKRGGIARVMTLKKQIKEESPNTLFLLAGDTISPSVESITYRGAQMIDAWNVAGVDYATFGNHEFDYGPATLVERMGESKFKWIAANVVDRNTRKPFGGAEAFVIREFGGVKVGIFGLVLPDTKNTSRPGPDIEFLNPCDTAKAMVSEIHARGAKVVVALTHLSMGEDKEVARCSDVDVIIGGHEHTLLESSAGGAPIFKMTADARELGRIDLNIFQKDGTLDSIDWKVIPVTPDIESDPQFATVTRKYSGLLRELARVVGRTSVTLNAASAPGRTQETNVGNLITDAFRRATGADVALMNGGSIRADEVFKPGVLTRRDVLSILPFKNKVLKLQITGATLRAALEHGVARSAEDTEPGRFPQVSGIRFSFDANKPAGSRVVNVTVNGQPLDDKRKYTLATSNFIAIDGGDGYTMFKGAPLTVPLERAPLDSDVLTRYISSARAIAPKTDGRIERLDKKQALQTDCN